MAGLPVIGTRVDGVPEMLSENESGLLVPVADEAALTQALRQLVENPALRQRMGKVGQQLILEQGKFTPEGMVARVEACYGRWLTELGAHGTQASQTD